MLRISKAHVEKEGIEEMKERRGEKVVNARRPYRDSDTQRVWQANLLRRL